MSSSNEQTTDLGRSSSLSGTGQSSRNPPLVIVSERGRHSDESRRLVRAQAARASAAQSRVTRARNREGRESTTREVPQSPASVEQPQPIPQAPDQQPDDSPAASMLQRPLVSWLTSTLNLSASGLIEHVQALPTAIPTSLSGLTSPVSAARGIGTSAIGGIGSVFGSIASVATGSGDSGRLQLPLAVPKGFATLQQRIQLSGSLVTLLSRTACFDFGSPGVEERLHQLLFDLIMSQARAIFMPLSVQSGHPIQGHFRIACTCLTIFQGQRANGQTFANEPKYQNGLEAAWSEAMLLDQNALSEPKSAEASLWAVFIISVTTNSTTNFFHQILQGLFQDLQLQYWPQVRSVLLEFIYPGYFLDEPCRSFYEKLQPLQVGVT